MGPLGCMPTDEVATGGCVSCQAKKMDIELLLHLRIHQMGDQFGRYPTAPGLAGYMPAGFVGSQPERRLLLLIATVLKDYASRRMKFLTLQFWLAIWARQTLS